MQAALPAVTAALPHLAQQPSLAAALSLLTGTLGEALPSLLAQMRTSLAAAQPLPPSPDAAAAHEAASMQVGQGWDVWRSQGPALLRSNIPGTADHNPTGSQGTAGTRCSSMQTIDHPADPCWPPNESALYSPPATSFVATWCCRETM
jgi:hypothetical protein